MKSIKWFITFFAFLSISLVLYAYPITPRPLRKLCLESELIIVAKAGKSIPVKKENGMIDDAKARLHISSIIKGHVNKEIIECYYSPHMVCPQPARYPEGEVVLAFLDKRKNGDGYYTHALSYGSKVLSENDLQTYLNFIYEFFNIQEIEDKNLRDKELIDWLVRCAEEPATRLEGAYELSRSGDYMSHYDKSEDPKFSEKLTEELKARLADALFSSSEIRAGELCLIDLIKDTNDERLIPFLLDYLKSIIDNPPNYTDQLMTVISEIIDNDEAMRLAKKFDDIYYEKETEELKKDILIRFINLINYIR